MVDCDINSMEMAKGLSVHNKVELFNRHVHDHKQKQEFLHSPIVTMTKDRKETHFMQAQMINDIIELCIRIDAHGKLWHSEPDLRMMTFGELQKLCVDFDDKLMTTLLRMRKYKYISNLDSDTNDNTILFLKNLNQNVRICLTKPLNELRQELTDKLVHLQHKINYVLALSNEVTTDDDECNLSRYATPCGSQMLIENNADQDENSKAANTNDSVLVTLSSFDIRIKYDRLK